MESQLRDAAVNDDKPADFIRDPYPYFTQKRDGAGVFHGTVVDYSKTPESLRPKNSFAAMSFDAVNTAFRDGTVFSSTYYDHTIGLFIGPSILAMEGKKHREHRNLVSAAFKSKALTRWEPAIVRPICDALVDEFISNQLLELLFHTRRTLDDRNPGGWIPEQKTAVAEAVHAYTVGSAYAQFDEEIKGSLEPGKLADLVVLSRDIFHIDPVEIQNTRVDLTICDGRIVYDASALKQ